MRRFNKYGRKKTEQDGKVFDSKLEARRYNELSLLQKAGEIKDLEWQIPFELIVNDTLVCKYIADFMYSRPTPDNLWELVIEDAKGYKTPEFIIKWKLAKALHPSLTWELYPAVSKPKRYKIKRLK